MRREREWFLPEDLDGHRDLELSFLECPQKIVKPDYVSASSSDKVLISILEMTYFFQYYGLSRLSVRLYRSCDKNDAMTVLIFDIPWAHNSSFPNYLNHFIGFKINRREYFSVIVLARSQREISLQSGMWEIFVVISWLKHLYSKWHLHLPRSYISSG